MKIPMDYGDQRAIFDPSEFSWPVHLIGAGGIGSALFLPLLKLGIGEMHVWDPDVVEPHNIPAQLLYRPSDVGSSKVECLRDFSRWVEADCEVVAHPQMVTEDTELSGVVISGVDSMASRKQIWAAVRRNAIDVVFYLDGRIGGEQFELYSLCPCDPDESRTYEDNWLVSDEQTLELPCAARTVIHPPVVLAGEAVAHLTRFYRQLPVNHFLIGHLRCDQFITEGLEQRAMKGAEQ
jgi:molybdopterin/thiamine biosynthesis adenylyltransferase